MDAVVKEHIMSIVDMDVEMGTWDSMPSLQVIWRDETGVTTSSLGVPDIMWNGVPPAFPMLVLSALMAGQQPIPAEVAMAVQDKREFLGLVLFTEAWGMSANDRESLQVKRKSVERIEDHPDAFEFKTALALSDDEVFQYTRTRKEGEAADRRKESDMGGPLIVALRAVNDMLAFSRSSGRVLDLSVEDE